MATVQATDRAPAMDPVILALTQNRLDHISHQMGWVMVRTARSPIFSQAHDFSCFIARPTPGRKACVCPCCASLRRARPARICGSC